MGLQPPHSLAPRHVVPWGQVVSELLTLLKVPFERVCGRQGCKGESAFSCSCSIPTPVQQMDSATAKLWLHIWVSLFMPTDRGKVRKAAAQWG